MSLAVNDFRFMPILKLKIDVSGTVGDAAWKEIRQFDQILSLIHI